MIQNKHSLIGISRIVAAGPAVAILSFLATSCVEPLTTSQRQLVQNANIDQPVHKEYLWNVAKEFKENSIVAEDKYLLKPVEIYGLQVSSLDDGTTNDTVNITFSATLPPGAGWELFGASTDCEVPRNHPAVRALKVNDDVVARGVFISESSGLKMDRCKFFVTRLNQWL
ncbi:hypothetical protein [Synechococcus sp. CB0205]|uniref:hypothetical protein n=1 Tax=Synechococcus sp. CB0205 TaxID=232363 RepID=UPI0012E9B884|nr:hypothetical protein [Synechococcus sp. CB0205]